MRHSRIATRLAAVVVVAVVSEVASLTTHHLLVRLEQQHQELRHQHPVPLETLHQEPLLHHLAGQLLRPLRLLLRPLVVQRRHHPRSETARLLHRPVRLEIRREIRVRLQVLVNSEVKLLLHHLVTIIMHRVLPRSGRARTIKPLVQVLEQQRWRRHHSGRQRIPRLRHRLLETAAQLDQLPSDPVVLDLVQHRRLLLSVAVVVSPHRLLLDNRLRPLPHHLGISLRVLEVTAATTTETKTALATTTTWVGGILRRKLLANSSRRDNAALGIIVNSLMS
mmetsp:Transcript_13184/g.32172  ORF Transcript_13184/g.32172 Transcript_13184/m.32172 type:complete len:279 (+) Transcript_13184:1913-2749(+)